MKRLLSTILLAAWTGAVGQNLVPNPSFEEFQELPCAFVDFHWPVKETFNAILTHWVMPTTGTSDVYSLLVADSCETYPSLSVRFGTPNPKDGNNMVGIYVGVFDRPSTSPYYREYVQVRLKEKLVPGQRYVAGFLHSLPSSTLASNNLGMLFTTEKVALDTNGILNLKPQVNSEGILVNKMQWQLFYEGFIAEDTSEYLTIGNFFTDEETKFKEVGPFGSAISYYLIDSVFVEKYSDPFIPNILTSNNDGKNDIFIIQNSSVPEWKLSVYNRWGSQVYFKDNYQNNWNGEELSPGVYYYILEHPKIGVTYKGILTIIH